MKKGFHAGLRIIPTPDPKSEDTLMFNTNVVLNEAGVPLAIYFWPNEQVCHYDQNELDNLYEPLSFALTEVERTAGKQVANIMAKLQAMEEIETTSVSKHTIFVTKGVAFDWNQDNLIDRVYGIIEDILLPYFPQYSLKKQVKQITPKPKKRKLKKFTPENHKPKKRLETIFSKTPTTKFC